MNCPARTTQLAGWLLIIVAISGCHHGPQMVPVTGKVTLGGKPLAFGVITFQPPSGQPAQGNIQSDGTFSLSTYKQGDGAVVGKHKIRIACFESQRPGTVKGPGEQSLGKSLIPERYTLFDQSGFTADVSESRTEPFTFDMTGPRG
jgi:hypothetical protein